MNDLTAPLQKIEAEINILKTQTAQNIIEIGKRLIEAKKQVPHGEWGKWLEEKVEFTCRTAQKFMEIATEISNTNTYSYLSTSKIYALLEVPAKEREEFVKNNNVEGMTTKELQKAIKERDEAMNKLAELKNKPPKTIEKIIPPSDYASIKSALERYKQDAEAKQNKITALENKMEEIESDTMEYRELKKKIDFLRKEKSNISRQIESATELAELTVTLHDTLKKDLAPIKFSRCMEQLEGSNIAIKNLTEIIEMVENWAREIRGYLPNKNIINVEVIK